jgi:uncharacterized protein involved in outer membrane biogenesis
LRALGIALAVVVLLVALLVVAAEVALRNESVRRSILTRVTPMIEESLGVDVEVDDFSASVLFGRLTIDGIVARATGTDSAPPLATVARIRATWRPLSLLSGHLRLHDLEIVDPAVDLGSPLPQLSESEAEGAPDIPVSIDRIRVTGGSAVGPVPDELAHLLAGWRVSDVAVDGRLERSEFAVQPLTAAIDIQPTDMDAVVLAVQAEARGEVGGDVEISSFRLNGDPISVQASGAVGTEERDLNGQFSADADPGFWLGQSSDSRVAAKGTVDLAAWRGSLTVSGQDLPGNLLAGFLEASLVERLEIESTEFAVEGEFQLVGDDGAAGTIRARAEREGAQIVELIAEPTVPAGLLDGATLPLSIDRPCRCFRLAAAHDNSDQR